MTFEVKTEVGKFTRNFESKEIHPARPDLNTSSKTSTTVSWTNSKGRSKGHWGDWKKLIANGFCATTDLSGTETKVKSAPGSYYVERFHVNHPEDGTPVVIYSGRGDFVATGSPSAFDVASEAARNASLSSFYQNLAAVEGTFKGLTFSGELRESLRMLRHPFKALRDGLGTYLGSVKKRAKRTTKSKRLAMVRDTWLETSYGWRPLISDCDSAVEAFYQSKATLPLFKMVRGRGKAVETRLISSNGVFLSNLAGRILGTTVDQSIISYRHYGTYVSRGDGVGSAIHTFGFTPWEFVPTLWELIPYSFLVDYFSNIGKILESWSYRNLGPSFCSEGSRRSRMRTITGRWVTASAGAGVILSGSGDGGTYTRETSTYVRTPNIGTPIPTLSLKVPGNWVQWANMAALAAQAKSVTKVLIS